MQRPWTGYLEQLVRPDGGARRISHRFRWLAAIRVRAMPPKAHSYSPTPTISSSTKQNPQFQLRRPVEALMVCNHDDIRGTLRARVLINHREADEYGPIHHALEVVRPNIIKPLLDLGADAPSKAPTATTGVDADRRRQLYRTSSAPCCRCACYRTQTRTLSRKRCSRWPRMVHL